MDKQTILHNVVEALQACDDILSARVYGSWLHDDLSRDLDIAVMIPSDQGIVEPRVYGVLRALRTELCTATGHDIDLVPHTEDELAGHISPMRYPRHNPSIARGRDIKGKVLVDSIAPRTDTFDYAALAAYVILDDRTVTRRQLVRSLTPEEARVYVSKLLHGPGSALTWRACNWHTDALGPPARFVDCIKRFDERFGVDTVPALPFLLSCKSGIGFPEAEQLMRWYEHLVLVTLYAGLGRKSDYNATCIMLGGAL